MCQAIPSFPHTYSLNFFTMELKGISLLYNYLTLEMSFTFYVPRVSYVSWMCADGKLIFYSHTHLGILFWNNSTCRVYLFLFTEHSFNSQAGRYAAEDLVVGMRRSGQMSVVRRFFCLFVTFDLLFTCLLWLIIILVCILYNVSHLAVNHAVPSVTRCIRITLVPHV
jgi:hypothetical protein